MGETSIWIKDHKREKLASSSVYSTYDFLKKKRCVSTGHGSFSPRHHRGQTNIVHTYIYTYIDIFISETKNYGTYPNWKCGKDPSALKFWWSFWHRILLRSTNMFSSFPWFDGLLSHTRTSCWDCQILSNLPRSGLCWSLMKTIKLALTPFQPYALSRKTSSACWNDKWWPRETQVISRISELSWR